MVRVLMLFLCGVIMCLRRQATPILANQLKQFVVCRPSRRSLPWRLHVPIRHVLPVASISVFGPMIATIPDT